MHAIDGSFLDFKQLDLLAMRDTTVHRLDPRAKLLTTLCFIVCVVSFDKYQVSAMLPFFIYPVALSAAGDLPQGYILRKTLFVLPFALLVGLFNPVFDRQVLLQIGGVGVSGGWISCLSILVRAVLTASAAIVLVAVTGFPAICEALEKLRIPSVFAQQLLFLYRYIFVLTEEGVRTARAWQLRSSGRRGLGPRQFGAMAGHLLIRTWERAERIYLAMLARGFSGEVRATRRQGHFGKRELLFTAGWGALFILLRLCNVPQLLGSFFTGHLQ